jgi:5-methylcytosine-specific restriction enzyme subunit McrC
MDPKHWRQQGFDYEEDRDLYEAIVPGFAFQLEKALRQGPLVGYRREEEALQTVRGRIRFDDQLRYRFGLIPPIECRYEEFSEDIELNRQLKAALDRLSRIRLRSTHTKRRLRTLRAAFGNVSSILYDPRQIPEVQFNRLNDHFRRPTEFARLILRARSLDIRAGAVSGAAMVLDMSGVFEDFVVKALREALGLSGRAFPQQSKGRSLYLAEDHHLRLKPDLSWWQGNRCVFVGDAKYKKTPEAGGVRHPDMYQLLAYATATELPTGMLIYAAGETEERVFDVANTDKKLEVRTLDLDQHPDHVLTQVASLASRIQEMRSMAAMAPPISPGPPVGQQLV